MDRTLQPVKPRYQDRGPWTAVYNHRMERKSTKLADFPAAELDALAAEYPLIKEEIDELADEEIVQVRLPELDDRQKRLEVLRELDERGELEIRISAAGNLRVCVLEAPGIADEAYLRVLHRPATTR